MDALWLRLAPPSVFEASDLASFSHPHESAASEGRFQALSFSLRPAVLSCPRASRPARPPRRLLLEGPSPLAGLEGDNRKKRGDG